MSGHDHGTATSRHRGRLLIALGITVSVVMIQFVGALLSGSLALLADTGHMLTDAAGLVVALIANALARRPPTAARTFGLQRAEILAALANGLLLTAIAVGIAVEAVRRWDEPPDVQTGIMLAVAVVGLVANVTALLVLRGGQRESLNVRGAYLEVLGDMLGSVAVIVAALVIIATGYQRADVLASFAIVVLIVPRAWSLVRDVVDVLLESTPRGVDLDEVRRHMAEVPGVVDVHDLHAWTITSGLPVLSAHVVVDRACIDGGRTGEVLDELGRCLTGHFDIEHSTFQLEPIGHRSHESPSHA